MQPYVRHMLLCEDVRPNADHPNTLDVFGLVNTVRPTPGSAFPLYREQICAYMTFTGRGTGVGQIVGAHAATGEVAFASQAHVLNFGTAPLAIRGVTFRIRNCIFQKPGLYWVQFRYNQAVLAQEPLLVKEPEHEQPIAT